ncbi:Vms1/Ankzf1 family peptidyl-tRNA hydrolase [Streptomyces sp. RFCAC02]|uniref:baeRF2 domain-containing protein n=1 Tax=Streptomyces sp. RFCAC02 TaxID=2499143 RepID=UPI00102179A8|nr:Vms1/Ankzf1 family peptidyl-tRNA hydrolase [Streptomyces sp. RFCAC02]
MKLDFLDPVLTRPGPWASVYLDTSRTDENAVPVAGLQARDACDRLAADGADDATCRAVYATLEGLGLSGRDVLGHAVFATDGETVLDVPLPHAPPSPPVTGFAPLPRLGPLLDGGAPEPSCLVAYVDRRGADLELRSTRRHPSGAGHATGQQWPLHRTGRDDWSERHFQLAVENTWEENARHVAEVLAAEAERTGAGMVVVAGDPRERRSVWEQLPEHLRAVAYEADAGGRAAGADNSVLDAEIDAARADLAGRRAAEVLDRFRAGRMPEHGDAAEGVRQLVDAARQHRIDALLMRSGSPDLHRDVWVGEDPDQVAVRRTDAQALGVDEPRSARADDALLRSAAATGADVVPLPAEADARDAGLGPPLGSMELPAGGMGALLRWPYRDGVPDGGHRVMP